MVADRSYRRHLPHQIPPGVPIFVTWNLKGALPREVVNKIRVERQRLSRLPDRKGESVRERRMRESKLILLMADRHLDSTSTGPMHLRDPSAAKIVEDSIVFGVPERCDLYAWCVMANHVHALMTPRIEFSDLMQGIKGFTAHEINAVQGARGRVFWQDESYDHWARDHDSFLKISLHREQPGGRGIVQAGERMAMVLSQISWPLARRSAFPG